MAPPSGRWRLLVRVCLLALGVALIGPVSLLALEWGFIAPGQTAMDAVRARYGNPSRTATEKIEGYDSTQWVYEGAQAPTGMIRMVVDFGLLGPSGYRPQVVRSVLLHPKPGTFNRNIVVQGWGPPSATGEQSGRPAYMYEDGLFVVFDSDVWDVETMLFTPKQRLPPPAPAPPR